MNIDETKYKVVNGTFYDPQTPDEVIRVLEHARETRTRLAIVYRAESRPEFGRVGRSTGSVKIPLLVHNTRSMGGEGICTNIIVEIRESEGGKVLYKAAEAS